MTPDISVIMPSYNAASWIGQAVESMLVQQGPSWELLIIDDGSTDATRAIAAWYAARDSRIRLLDNAGVKGPGAARNTGLAQTRGEAVAFLDSDDVYFPGALAALHTRLRESGKPAVRGLGAVICMQRWQASPQRLPAEVLRSGYEPVTYPKTTFWLHMFRADFLRRQGILFAPDLTRSEDNRFLSHAYTFLDTLPVINRIVHLYRYNHKRNSIAAEHAESYLTMARILRSMFQGTSKEAQIVPFIEGFFLLPHWLHCLYAVRQVGQERAKDYLARCLTFFSERREEFAPVLGRILGGVQEQFFALWDKNDTQGILDLLDEAHLLTPCWPYRGIEPRTGQTFGPAYTLPRLMANLVRNPQTRRAFFYLLRLNLRSLQRRLRTPGRDSAPHPGLLRGHRAQAPAKRAGGR